MDGYQQVGRLRCRREQVGTVEQHPRLGECSDREAVPGRDDLVVAGRAGAPFAGRQQHTADPVEPLGIGRISQPLEDRRAFLERARLGDAERPGCVGTVLRAERLGKLGRGPHVVGALAPVAVRIDGGGQAALGGAQLAQHELAGLLGDPAGQRVPRAPPQVGVDRGQQRVVVEHLLEVRHGPAAELRCSGRSRRRAGHRCPRGPSPRRSPRPSLRAHGLALQSARRSGAGTPASSTAGTWVRHRSRRGSGRSPPPGRPPRRRSGRPR